MNFPDDKTLGEARVWLRSQVFAKGAKCPCCKQFAKVYKRQINSAMAYAICIIYSYFKETRDDGQWLHVPSYLNSVGLAPKTAAAIRGDWAKLVHWGFLDPQPGQRDDGSVRTGYYRITDTGKAFVERRLRVPRFKLLYSGDALDRKVSDETVDIDEALGAKFSYEDLMRRTGT